MGTITTIPADTYITFDIYDSEVIELSQIDEVGQVLFIVGKIKFKADTTIQQLESTGSYHLAKFYKFS